MNRNKRVSRMMLLGVAILVGGVLAGGFVVSSAQAAGRAQPPYPPVGRPVWPYGYGRWGHGGMMGGWGAWGYGIGPTTGITSSVPYGPAGCPGMGGWGRGYPDTDTPLSIDQATEVVQGYLAAYGNPDLALTEVMEFSNNFYAEVEEKSTGVHAFELLINRYTGQVYPEPGPNMMWNTKYGHMGGWWGGRPGSEVTVTPAQARQYAQQYLDRYLPETTVAEEADAFYGYYTIHVLQDGQIVGMLSVNGYTGQVWYHTWHGDFIGMAEGHD